MILPKKEKSNKAGRKLILLGSAFLLCAVLAACTAGGNASGEDRKQNAIETAAADPAPSITIEGTRYYAPFPPQTTLPYGYAYMGELTPKQADTSGQTGMQYYMAEGHDDVYVYSMTGAQETSEGSADEKWRYVRWVREEEIKGPDGIKSLMTLDDVIRIASVGDGLSWDAFEGFARDDIGSGRYVYRFTIDDKFCLTISSEKGWGQGDLKDCSIRLLWGEEDFADLRRSDIQAFIDKYTAVAIVDTNLAVAEAFEKFWEKDGYIFEFPEIRSENIFVVTADGGRTKLVEALNKGLILITDLPKFGVTSVHYSGAGGRGFLNKGLLPGPGDAATENIENVPASSIEPAGEPLSGAERIEHFKGLDTSEGLIVYMSMYGNDLRYGLLPGSAKKISWELFTDLYTLEPYDLVQLLESYNVPDEKVRVIALYEPQSCSLPAISSGEDFAKNYDISCFKLGWDGRFKTQAPIELQFTDGYADIVNDGSSEYPRPVEFDGAEVRSLYVLKSYFPKFFELDTDSGLTVCVFPSYDGKPSCVLYSGDVSYVTRSPAPGAAVSIPEMKKILKSYGLPDEMVRIRPYYPILGFYVSDRSAFESGISNSFDGRYSVKTEIKEFSSLHDRPLKTLMAVYPDLFSLDCTNGLTVCYSPWGGRILAGSKDYIEYSSYEEALKWGLLSHLEIQRILDWYHSEKGLADKDVWVYPMEDLYMGYPEIGTIRKWVEEIFGGRYEVKEEQMAYALLCW